MLELMEVCHFEEDLPSQVISASANDDDLLNIQVSYAEELMQFYQDLDQNLASLNDTISLSQKEQGPSFRICQRKGAKHTYEELIEFVSIAHERMNLLLSYLNQINLLIQNQFFQNKFLNQYEKKIRQLFIFGYQFYEINTILIRIHDWEENYKYLAKQVYFNFKSW
jgi:hypothetical protein